ncbi:MAG TPA: M48 family metallopeptidase [Paenalcaligenes hominis]|uniref:M48 family metallopeptidase n=1 Tax=Paenalcaligenes hominis TaxID=643674 RepID=A0A9D3A9B6_9BURK|nr:M48 family metallopeptidase [Paenalcaligenes hominis]
MTLHLRKPAKLPPQTQWRQTELNTQLIGYLLRRSARKSVGLRISDEGLIITAPHWASDSQIHEALQAKKAWILRKLSERQERLNQQAMSQTVWQDGGRLPYLGVSIQLQLNPLLRQSVFSGAADAPQPGDRLCLHLDLNADSQRIQDLCHVWLQQQAHTYLEQRIQHFLRLGSYANRFHRLRLASPQKRWGSCSSAGVIMLNWRLIHFEPAVIDYVVAHEVAHLKEMNHGPLFWQEVERLLPSFYTARQQLKQFDPASLPLF